MRITLHYLVLMLILPFYGIQVCPFVESLDPIETFLTFDGLLLMVYLVRGLLISNLVDSRPLVGQVRSILVVDMGLLVAAGLILSLYNVTVHDFPISSGFKIMVGMMAMGMFAATDSALQRERLVADKVEREAIRMEVPRKFFPLTTRLALYAGSFILLIVGVFTLLVIKDLDWLISIENELPLQQARITILVEFGFVLGVTLLHTGNLILSFTRNLNMFFVRENGVLSRATSGRYDTLVPISSNDEFGVMASHTNEMIRRIRERTAELNRTRDVTILMLASLAETRDNETGAHILRTQRYVKTLAQQLRHHPRFSEELDEEFIDLLYKSAPLHDVGKVGIPDSILLKPGKLSDDEFEIMKTHAQIGADALAVAEEELGTNSFLRLAREIALTHHEKWDGSGYPSGLRGNRIPVSGRLMAIADVYDALITKRVYKPAYPHARAMEIIRLGRDSHFDPDIVDAMVAVEDQFIEIAQSYSDEAYIETFELSARGDAA